jgi:hypothetical protein
MLGQEDIRLAGLGQVRALHFALQLMSGKSGACAYVDATCVHCTVALTPAMHDASH